ALAPNALATAVSAATPTPGPAASLTPSPSPTPVPTPVPVSVDKDGFHPTVIRIYAGQSVAWTNLDKLPHAATASDGSWDTGEIAPSKAQALQFFEIGKWDYLDGFNPIQHGTLIVATPSPAPSGAP
ncbi:MAG: cupredoxin domain-containing protein, partial [Candidatus Eremiobacteraeota bacterium]|nr:cupredoxin domain-containing protein [Candidatus Eremiobacteraeota bacterium]